MSGGSWDYVCYKIADVAERLESEKHPLRRALGKHMQLVSNAMHSIEWVDSCDYSEGDEIDDIKKVLGDSAKSQEITILIEDAKNIIRQLNNLGVK